MGRPPSTGGPAFRFNSAEVQEMETILQDHNNMMPAQEVLVAIADKFSNSPERHGKFVVQTKQIWNWFQNKRYAIRARSSKIPTIHSMSTGAPMHSTPVVSTTPAVKPTAGAPVAPYTPAISREDNFSSSRLHHSVAESPGRVSADNTPMEFEARSARDGAWYDVASFLSVRNLEAGNPEVLVRFAGFGSEEDEWINVTTHVRHRSLPCESSECVAVLPGDLILCFQEGKEQALYFDAHVLDAQRRRHDARGCRCRFLVRYDHDQSEEIVPLRKICRRPETDYRLQQLHAMNESSAEQRQTAEQMKTGSAKDQHNIMSSTDQTKTNVDSPVQKPSSTSEEKKGSSDCSTEKPTVDISAAPGPRNAQHSHPEVINLDPETEMENNSDEVKDPTDAMDVDEQLEKQKPTDSVSTCGISATTETCPADEVDATVTQNVTEVVRNEASPTDGQVDPEPMAVETNSTTGDDVKTNIDQGKDNLIRSTDTSLPEMTASVGNITLEQEVNETSIATDDAGKPDIDEGNVTVSMTSSSDNADHPVNESDPVN